MVLSPEDALPVRHTFTPIPFPRFIRSLITETHYTRQAGYAVPQTAATVGEGSLLFFRKRFRIRMAYHDWELQALPDRNPYLHPLGSSPSGDPPRTFKARRAALGGPGQ